VRGAGVPWHLKQIGEWSSEPKAGTRVPAGVLMNDGRFLEGGSILDSPSESGEIMFRVGKKAAGRALDGVIHDARPAPLP
jgi:hypothetical protein